MEHRQLGRSGFKVPVLSFGTGTFGGGDEFFRAWGSSGVQEATRLVDICLEAGVTMFDSADVYSDGLAEETLGKAIQGRRNQVLISTKATFRMGTGPNDVGASRHHLINSVEGSLRRLGADHIDLFQLHGFDAMTHEVTGAPQMTALDEARAMTPPYPYWHQLGFAERNPFPTLKSK